MPDREIEASSTMDALTADDVTLLSLRQTLVEIMRLIGGPEGFAKLAMTEFGACPQGSPTRTNLLLNIMKLLSTYGVDDSADDIPPEMLEKLAKQIMASTEESK